MTVMMRRKGIGTNVVDNWTEEGIVDSFGAFVRPGFSLVVGVAPAGHACFGTCGTTRTDEAYDGHRVLDAQAVAVKQFSRRVFVLAKTVQGALLVEEFAGKLKTI